jgi:histidinol dehydrogenase
MKTNIQPDRASWPELCRRPVFNQEGLSQTVSEILAQVKNLGDEALREYAEKFEGVALDELKVTDEETNRAIALLPEALKNAIQKAAINIEKFHESQCIAEPVTETMKGIKCWRKSVGIEKVGLYIPGGSAPLFSTVLMLAIPAKLAGCREVILCSPANKQGEIHPAILYAANITGVTSVFKTGGAQAIAAMAFGTASIPRVNKIFGPGNQYVTRAKELVQQFGLAIDMPAGPSEVLIIADESCNPEFVAADLLAQAEHGPDSQVVLLTPFEKVAAAVQEALQKQLLLLPRMETAAKALENSFAVVLRDMGECMAFSNEYAPEHLVLATNNAAAYIGAVSNAGSVFLGNYSCESVGDYASGPNHTLPTNGYAKSYGGISVDSFVKKITFQEITPEGIENIGNEVALMAEAEGLEAHKNSVTIRLKNK